MSWTWWYCYELKCRAVTRSKMVAKRTGLDRVTIETGKYWGFEQRIVYMYYRKQVNQWQWQYTICIGSEIYINSFDWLTNQMVTHGDVPMSMMYSSLVSLTSGVSCSRRFLDRSQQCSSARWQRWKCPIGCSHSPTVGSVAIFVDEQATDLKMALTQSRLTDTGSTSLLLSRSLMLSDVLSLISDVSLFFWLQLHAFYTQSQIWKSVRHSRSLEHLPESSAMPSRNHSVTQVALPFLSARWGITWTLSVLRQIINIIRNFNSTKVLVLSALHCITHTQIC